MIRDKLDTKEIIPSLIISHLITFIKNITKLKHEIIFEIDDNEAFTSNSGYIAILWKKCNIMDPISTNHGTTVEPNKNDHGSQCIDYIFCFSEIYRFITKCGILHFCSIVTSCHRGLFIDANITQYLRNSFIGSSRSKQRIFPQPTQTMFVNTKTTFSIISHLEK